MKIVHHINKTQTLQYTLTSKSNIYFLHAEKVLRDLSLCFSNSLNSRRDWHSFKFIGGPQNAEIL